MPIACTPAALVNETPCLACASETQLDMVWLWLWATFGGFDLSTDLDEVMALGVPFMSLADRQMKEAKVALFWHFLRGLRGLDDLTLQEIMNDLKCLPCASPKLVRAATLALICDFFEAFDIFSD